MNYMRIKRPCLPAVTKKKKAPAKKPTAKRARPKAKVAAAAKKPARSRRKTGPPPYTEGEVYMGLYPPGAQRPYDDSAPFLSRSSLKAPPSGTVFWYKLAWTKPWAIPTDGSSSVLRVAYKPDKDKSVSMTMLKEHFAIPIRWRSFSPSHQLTGLDNGAGGKDWFWFMPSCIIQWADQRAKEVTCIHVCIINTNHAVDYGPPIWKPVVDSGDWLSLRFPGRYTPLPPCHPDKDIAIATTPTHLIPQRTPAWMAIRSAGSTAVTSIFDFYNDQGAVITRPNAAMLIGSQGEEPALVYWLWGRPSVSIQEISWTKHPTKGTFRGSSPDGLIEDYEIMLDSVPDHIIEQAQAAGWSISSIDWTKGVIEIKYSKESATFLASYLPQIYNHMICTERMYADLGKFCESAGTLSIWRIWRDASVEAALNKICDDPRIWEATGNYVEDITNSEEVISLGKMWKAQAAKLNRQGPDWIIRGEQPARLATNLRRAQQSWYLDRTHDGTPPRMMTGENATDPALSRLWMHGVDVSEAIKNLQDIQVTTTTELFPEPGRNFDVNPKQLRQLQLAIEAQRRVVRILEASSAYMEEALQEKLG